MSIRLRIVISFTFICTIITFIFSLYVNYYYSTYREDLFKNSLLVKAELVSHLYFQGGLKNLDKYVDSDDILSLYKEKLFVFAEDQLIYGNTDQEPVDFYLDLYNKNRSSHKVVYVAHEPYESILARYNDDKREIIIINSAIDLLGKSKLTNLHSILILGNIFSLFLSVFFSIIFSGSLLKPIKKIISQINKITGTDLDIRIEIGKSKDEIAQIAVNFNRMLGRMQRVFENQKNFISYASHELRTPLAIVLSTLETTIAYEKDPKKIIKNIKDTVGELKKSIELTNGLLQLATVNKETIIVFAPVRLDEILLNEISKIKLKYNTQDIIFNIGTIPDLNEPFKCMANELLLLIALFNILDNACKYANYNKVIVTLDYQHSHYKIEVQDFGIGIDDKDHPFIFEPLYRGSNVYDLKGLGIGLSLVQRIISLHNGKIELTSKLNEGTTVIVYLPAVSG